MTHAYTTYLLGGSKGIALDVAKRLAQQKQPLTLIARGASELTAVAKELTQLGCPEVTTISCDLSQAESVDKLCAQIAQDTRHIRGLVNAAGYFAPKAFLDQSRADYRQYLDLNEALFLATQAVAKNMKAHGGGSIVNIGSINGQAGQYGQVNYAAAKSGIHGFTKALAQEGAKLGITVNAVAPGYVDTEMVRAVPPDVLEKIIARIPRGRLGKTEDIARGVVFLTSDDADFITGSTLSINGGQHMY